ncbi:MAG: ABC transporter permease [Verrucomicrobia bacterium]|nr:ABC transporter permease [Verrucomicrobiota bacterium]
MNTQKPTYVVDADNLLSSNPRELWAYRGLFTLLVKRDFVAAYKQTVLGPLWFFFQPFLAALVYVIIFGQIARLPTSNLPPLVFYMSGIIAWNFFANCFSQVSYTFLASGSLFRKIYFPRLVIPLSQISMNFLNFLAQLLTLLVVVAVYRTTGSRVDLSPRIVLVPLLLLEMALLALGLGCLIAAATVKYRDLNIVVGYTLQLWMYGSLVIYPRESVPASLQGLLMLNPMASLIECYRSSLFGTEHAPLRPALVAAMIILGILVIGLWRFSRAEGTFTDSI